MAIYFAIVRCPCGAELMASPLEADTMTDTQAVREERKIMGVFRDYCRSRHETGCHACQRPCRAVEVSVFETNLHSLASAHRYLERSARETLAVPLAAEGYGHPN